MKHTQLTNPNPQFPEEFYQDPTGINRYVVQEKILFTWQSPSKVMKKYQRTELSSYGFGVVIITIILLLVNEYMLVILFLMVAGVIAFTETTQPFQLHCQISTIGIKVEDKYYYWSQLSQFWIEEKKNITFLYLRDLFPRTRIFRLIIKASDEDDIKNIVGKYILYKRPQESSTQKTLKPFTDLLPFDTDWWFS